MKQFVKPSTRRRRVPSRGLAEVLEPRRLLAFGVVDTGGTFVVDTDAGVTFEVLKQGDTNVRKSGDLMNFKRHGDNFAAPYSQPLRYSHFESGLSNSAAVFAQVDPAGQWVKITADDTVGTGVIQYYLARRGEPTVFMATYAPELRVSSTRFLAYLDRAKFPGRPDPSDISGGQTAIEAGDVFAEPGNGQTHSKYYGATRIIDHDFNSATGPGRGAFLFVGNRERGSGGPFWKDIDYQSTDSAVELYNIPFSDHSQTEPFRPGLHGPYALTLSDGSVPAEPNYDFFGSAGIVGWVGEDARGTLTGTARFLKPGLQYTVGLANASAQFFEYAGPGGSFTLDGILPGTYTMTLYEQELAVGSRSVTIAAGQTTTADLATGRSDPPAVWRIGTWDGTPREFLNADRITDMHPSDPRMTPWTDFIYTAGISTAGQWPMAMWKEPSLNDRNSIRFDLTSEQASADMVLRIGITRAQAGGRPQIVMNGNWSSVPGISPQPGTRGITLGSWRGNNWTYEFAVPANQLVAGTNQLDIVVASGSSSGSPWLQPQITFDAIDLVRASDLSVTPRSLGFSERTSTSMTLTWDAPPAATGYFVDRSTDGTNWSNVATLDRVSSWTDRNVTSGVEYYYRVFGFNYGRVGGQSPIAFASPPAAALPGGWTNQNIGAAAGGAGAGGAAISLGTGAFQVVSAGFDVFGQADAMNFTSQPLAGDGSLTVRVDSLETTDPAAKAGIILRENAAPGARSVALMINAGGGYGIDVRIRDATDGNTSYEQVLSAATVPYWLRLTRTGNAIKLEYSADGNGWIVARTISNFSFAGPPLIGFGSTSFSASQLNTSTFRNVQLTAANDAPTLTAGDYRFDGPEPFVRVQGSEPLFAGPNLAGVFLHNLTTGQTFTNLTKHAGPAGDANALVVRFFDAIGPLPNGNYRLTVPAGAVVDSQGAANVSAFTFDFFALAGDANRDRAVNLQDFVILRNHFNQSGRLFSEGDFNYDGKVNLADFVILRNNFAQSLPGPDDDDEESGF